MDAVRLGRQLRALRRKHSWRQVELAGRARVSHASISRLETGGAGRTSCDTVERVAAALGARLEVRLGWNGEALDRLLDAGHADLVERVVRTLARRGWLVVPEVSFSMHGERGSVDLLGFHVASRALVVVEVKSVVPDVQAALAAIDRKARLAPILARDRGWTAASVTRLLVIGDGRTARRRVAAHAATFGASFPMRGRAARRWLAEPSAPAPAGALLFMAGAHGLDTRHRTAARSPSGAQPTSS